MRKTILSWFRFSRRRLYLVPMSSLAEGTLTETERLQLVRTSHTFRAIHSIIAGGAGRLNWKAVKEKEVEGKTVTEELAVYSEIADASMGLAMADWYVIGTAIIGLKVPRRIGLEEIDYEGVKVVNDNCPLEAAKSLALKINELERAERQAYWRQGAQAFLTAKGATSGLVPTPAEVESLQKMVDDLRRSAGAGGVAVSPVPFEVTPISGGGSVKDYDFSAQRIMLLRELANLFRIDSSLLNDPENKTYSNKTEAEKAFFVNVIIPEAYRFLLDANRALRFAGAGFQLAVDVSVVEPIAEERARAARQVVELLTAGLISREEGRAMLQGSGILPERTKKPAEAG